jgi:hypothetical protein
MRERKGVYRVLVGKPEGKRPLGRPRLRWEDNRVLRRIFGPKGDEVTGEWRKLHNEELKDLYSLPNILGK